MDDNVDAFTRKLREGYILESVEALYNKNITCFPSLNNRK